MRCGCPVCSTYMIQSERGVFSGCVCPNCGAVCTACVSAAGQTPASLAEIVQMNRVSASMDSYAEEADIAFEDEHDRPSDWLKRL